MSPRTRAGLWVSGILVGGLALYMIVGRRADDATSEARPGVRPATPVAVELAKAPAPSAAAAPVPDQPAPGAPPAAASEPGKPLPSLLGPEFQGGAPAGDPAMVDRYIARHSKDEQRLLSRLARAEIVPPPELKRLFELRKKGASPAELVAFMQREFPGDTKLRVLTAAWLEDLEAAGGKPGQAGDLKRGGRRPAATIEPAGTAPAPAQTAPAPAAPEKIEPAKTAPVSPPAGP